MPRPVGVGKTKDHTNSTKVQGHHGDQSRLGLCRTLSLSALCANRVCFVLGSNSIDKTNAFRVLNPNFGSILLTACGLENIAHVSSEVRRNAVIHDLAVTSLGLWWNLMVVEP